MYARQTANARASKDLKLPPNYGGSAFYNLSADSAQEPEQEVLSSDQQESDLSAELPTSAAVNEKESKSESVGLFHGFGGSSGGIGLEELLILGLALIISQNDTKDDLALLLLLLVFIK